MKKYDVIVDDIQKYSLGETFLRFGKRLNRAFSHLVLEGSFLKMCEGPREPLVHELRITVPGEGEG